LSVKLSVKFLPMNSVSSTDGINSSVKLFNGVVFIDFELIIIIYFDLFSKKITVVLNKHYNIWLVLNSYKRLFLLSYH
jgi:hypothetical protein